MAEGGVCKRFLVLDERSGRKCMIQFKDYQTFDQACKKKFGYPQDKGVIFVLEDDQDIELDESAFECYKDNTQFRIRPIADETPNTGNTEHTGGKKKFGYPQDKGVIFVLEDDQDIELDESAFECYKDNTQFRIRPIADETPNTGNTEHTGETDEDNTKIENSSDAIDFAENTSDALSIREAFQKGGETAVNDLVPRKLNQWKECIINVGITGNSGVGKSSFINALRGLTADDDGAAKVGVTETTMEPTPYRHPGNENVLLWDLPGVNTPAFPRDEYLGKIDATLYDYFIMISAIRFTEIDRWLGEQLQTMNKKFYFVRTKIHMDVENDKRSHPRTHDEKKLLETVRRDCLKQLGNTGYIGTVYLIDNFVTDKYDFNTLCCRLINDASEFHREAMLFTITCFSQDIILAKKAALQKRIFYASVISGIFGALPIPGLDVAVDIAALVEEANHYKQQFGLSDAVLEKFAKTFALETHLLEFTKQGITRYMVSSLGAKKLTEYGAKKILKYIFPGYGNYVSGVASYSSCSVTLIGILEMCCNDALKISSFMKNIQ